MDRAQVFASAWSIVGGPFDNGDGLAHSNDMKEEFRRLVYDALTCPPLSALPEGWRPIETAPKNGSTMLLGYLNIAGKWRTTRGQWMSEDEIAETWKDPDDGEEGWYETCVEADDIPNCWRINPSHWMPLPKAPDAPKEPKA